MQIKFLAREGVPKSRIARRLGVTRQTVYNHLSRTEPFPKPRPKRVSKLDAFKAYVRSRLELFDLPATVLLLELREQGYAGELTLLRDYARTIKKELVRRVTERFETLPGHQAQIDWGECGTIEVGGERRKLYVFVLVLGYSRMMYAHFTTSSKLPVLLRCLAHGFDVLGVPAEILVDNMKQAVDQHDVTTGTVRWNRQFLDFADHHGFLPVACPPYWPRVKGKVERGVGYIKTSFLEGRSFTDLADLNRQLEA
jgi:transposase